MSAPTSPPPSSPPSQPAWVCRAAEARDAPALRRIAEAAYRPYIARMEKPPAPISADYDAAIAARTVQVATTAQGQPVGFIIHFARAEDWFVENLAIAPEAQGTGLGQHLLGLSEVAGAAAGYPALRLYTNVAMAEAVGFYRRLGYREIGKVHEEGFDRIYFERSLG